MTTRLSPLLRGALIADAAASGAMAILLTVGAGFLDGLLGLDTAFMRSVGLFLIPYAAFVGILGTRESLPAAVVWLVVVGNAVWAAASIAVLIDAVIVPTALGTAFVIAQAVLVGLFAELQYFGLRQARLAAA